MIIRKLKPFIVDGKFTRGRYPNSTVEEALDNEGRRYLLFLVCHSGIDEYSKNYIKDVLYNRGIVNLKSSAFR